MTKIMSRAAFVRLLAAALCLAGAGAAWSAERRKARVHPGRCVGCGDCSRICPVKAVRVVRGKAVVDERACKSCRLCVNICSYGAIAC